MAFQHPFISQAKPVSILRDLITEAMEMKAKRQQEQQRELEEEDDNSVRMLRCCSWSNHQRATHEGYMANRHFSCRMRRRRWTLTQWWSPAQRELGQCGPPAPWVMGHRRWLNMEALCWSQTSALWSLTVMMKRRRKIRDPWGVCIHIMLMCIFFYDKYKVPIIWLQTHEMCHI